MAIVRSIQMARCTFCEFAEVSGVVPGNAVVGDVVIFQHNGKVHMYKITKLRQANQKDPKNVIQAVTGYVSFNNLSGAGDIKGTLDYFTKRGPNFNIQQLQEIEVNP